MVAFFRMYRYHRPLIVITTTMQTIVVTDISVFHQTAAYQASVGALTVVQAMLDTAAPHSKSPNDGME